MRGDNPYRTKAYLRAADSLMALSQPLDRIIATGALTKIPGIGDAIADIVTKLYQTGTHPSLEKLRGDVPAGVLELFAVPGLRPDKILKLHQVLGVSSLAEFEAAAKQDRIRPVKGLGAALPAEPGHCARARADRKLHLRVSRMRQAGRVWLCSAETNVSLVLFRTSGRRRAVSLGVDKSELRHARGVGSGACSACGGRQPAQVPQPMASAIPASRAASSEQRRAHRKMIHQPITTAVASNKTAAGINTPLPFCHLGGGLGTGFLG